MQKKIIFNKDIFFYTFFNFNHSVKFWQDVWVPTIPDHAWNMTVNHDVSQGVWDWSVLHGFLPSDICGKIAGLKPIRFLSSFFPLNLSPSQILAVRLIWRLKIKTKNCKKNRGSFLRISKTPSATTAPIPCVVVTPPTMLFLDKKGTIQRKNNALFSVYILCSLFGTFPFI